MYVPFYVCMYMFVCMEVYVCEQREKEDIHTYIHTYTYTYTYIYIPIINSKTKNMEIIGLSARIPSYMTGVHVSPVNI